MQTTKNVSMPYIWLIPFLHGKVDRKAECDVFQCPTSGSSHFYGIPSQPPIKSVFPGLILGGNSQNILKTTDLP